MEKWNANNKTPELEAITEQEKEQQTYRKEQQTYRKEQLLTSEGYRPRCDLLSAILKDDMEYTLDTVNDMIEGFMKGKVK